MYRLLIAAAAFGIGSSLLYASSDTQTENNISEDETKQAKPVTAYLHALTNKPLELNYRPTQTITDAVAQFHETGTNPYTSNADALKDGTKIYKKLCQACHLKDGTGRIGPNLTDDTYTRQRTNTEIGRFEIIYGGGAGAMQAFGRRIDQDDILKVMVFIDTLKK